MASPSGAGGDLPAGGGPAQAGALGGGGATNAVDHMEFMVWVRDTFGGSGRVAAVHSLPSQVPTSPSASALAAAIAPLEQVCAQCIRNAPQLCPPFPLAWDSNLLLHSTGGCALRSDGSAFSVAPAGTGVCAMYSQRPSNFPPFPSCLGFTPAASLNRRLCPGSVRAELLPPAWLCPPSIPHLWCIIFHGPAGHRRSACCCGAPGRWAS